MISIIIIIMIIPVKVYIKELSKQVNTHIIQVNLCCPAPNCRYQLFVIKCLQDDLTTAEIWVTYTVMIL